MWVKFIQTFRQYQFGEVVEMQSDETAKAWIADGKCKRTVKPKAVKSPPRDKSMRAEQVKTK